MWFGSDRFAPQTGKYALFGCAGSTSLLEAGTARLAPVARCLRSPQLHIEMLLGILICHYALLALPPPPRPPPKQYLA